jgi:type I restriction enzyme M protein
VTSDQLNELENRLWAAADQLWANTGLKPADFSTPVLGLIFLSYADRRFREVAERYRSEGQNPEELEPYDYQAEGVLYLKPEARFSRLLDLPEGAELGKAINNAMAQIEADNPELKGVLPRTYNKLDNAILVELLRLLAPVKLTGDAFGKVYEYFLGKFALKEGQKGGVFYTPESIVKLIVEIIAPYHGRVFDPACGSGGMFVHSAAFVERHQKKATEEISVYGTEKAGDTVKLAKMNLAVHGLSGDILEANTYYEDPHDALGRFDFVMANPPFNVSGVDKERLKGDRRFPLGLPNTDNANYLWIQLFHAALNDQGRAGFVMANSAADARGTELDIRKKLIQSGAVDAIVSVSSNFFYTVTLPCTLWFFDKGKASGPRKNKVLFLDARHVYRQVSRAIRDFLPEQVEYLANIVRMYRGELVEDGFDVGWADGYEPESPFPLGGHGPLIDPAELFPGCEYRDVPGLCKVATIEDIEAQGWSLNPGRYVGVAAGQQEDVDFAERLKELNEELERLNGETGDLEQRIAANVSDLLALSSFDNRE